MSSPKSNWGCSETLALVGVVVAILSLGAAVVIPEVRLFLGLENNSNSSVVNPEPEPAPTLEPEPAPTPEPEPEPGLPLFASQCSIPPDSVFSGNEDPRRVIYQRLLSPAYLDMCLRVEFTDEILEQAGGYENARQMALKEGAKLETSSSQATSHLPLYPTGNYSPRFVSTLAGDSDKGAVQTVRPGDKHSVNLIVNSRKYGGEITVVDASTSEGVTEFKILVNFGD